MKKLLIGMLLLNSLAALAGNPELEALFKTHKSTLMNFKVGMTASTQKSTTTEYNDGEKEHEAQSIESVILKVVGTKVYEYRTVKVEGEEASHSKVVLIDYGIRPEEWEGEANVSVETNHLFFNIFTNAPETEEYMGRSQVVTVEKDLRTTYFCDIEINTKSKEFSYAEESSYEEFSLELKNKKCGADKSVAEIKEMDLSEVMFCDLTTAESEDGEDECQIRDMRLLTSDL